MGGDRPVVRVVTRAAYALALLCASACAAGPPPRPAPASDGAVAIAPVAPPPPTLEARLAALTVSDDDYYRPVLYTWTQPAQIGILRGTRKLLVATATSGGFVSPFNRAIAAVAAGRGKGARVARALMTNPALIRRRYAWPAPLATVMGIGARGYGTSLIRIELRAEAWIGRFEPAAARPFDFVDARGAPVALADVLAAPERIGAIFHVRADRGVAIRFREYIVCNPQMVASWSVATPAIRAEVDAEIELLRALRERLADLPRGVARQPATPAWRTRPEAPDPLLLWRAAVAFDNPRYRADPASLDAIIDALLAYDPAGDPLIQ